MDDSILVDMAIWSVMAWFIAGFLLVAVVEYNPGISLMVLFYLVITTAIIYPYVVAVLALPVGMGYGLYWRMRDIW